MTAALALGLAASLISVALETPRAEAAVDDIYEITFPVIGPTYFSDTFNACRDGCSRTHGATDIMSYGVKGLPIVAAHSGTIRWMANEQGGRCCAIWGLVHEDGWETWYIHMNNDTAGTDDGQGWGFAPGIEPGATVVEGQLLGWVGDSGNAERISPHLHFEIRDAGGARVNPYFSLLVAQRALMPRIAGADRFVTAVEVSRSAFSDGAAVAYIATGRDFADALAGGPAAASAGGPVLLSDPDWLPAVTAEELARLAPGQIVILGGTGAISETVEAGLAAFAPDVVRLAGHNRFSTAAAISTAHFSPGVDRVYVANGLGFADALSGAPAAAKDGAPLLLVLPDQIPQSTAEELLRLQPASVVVLGGDAVISSTVASELADSAQSGTVVRLAGANRYETSAAISAHAFAAADQAYVATGLGFADALAGVSLASLNNAPILLIEDAVSSAVAAELLRLGLNEATILGGPGAVSDNADADLWNVFNGGHPTW